MAHTHKYYKIYKPYGMLSQFIRQKKNHGVLGDLYPFEKDIYPVGRLDLDSEGLLLLTNDKKLNDLLLMPKYKHNRSYLVQVDGQITEKARIALENRVEISIEGKKHLTLPAKAELLPEPPDLPERHPPVRYRKLIPTSWIRLTLQEGKNRQVRRMTAAVGFPTLRLVRESIENITVHGMNPGDVVELDASKIYRWLNIGK